MSEDLDYSIDYTIGDDYIENSEDLMIQELQELREQLYKLNKDVLIMLLLEIKKKENLSNSIRRG